MFYSKNLPNDILKNRVKKMENYIVHRPSYLEGNVWRKIDLLWKINALSRSNNQDPSKRAHLFLIHHLIYVPWRRQHCLFFTLLLKQTNTDYSFRINVSGTSDVHSKQRSVQGCGVGSGWVDRIRIRILTEFGSKHRIQIQKIVFLNTFDIFMNYILREKKKGWY